MRDPILGDILAMDEMIDRSRGKWYILHTLSGKENKVQEKLKCQIALADNDIPVYEVLIPMEKITEIKNGKQRIINRKIFPGYVLVKVAVMPDKDNRPAMSDEAWLLIRNTRGVTGFVGPENKAIPLTDEEVIRLGVEKRSVEVSYEVGDTVNIIDEIFDGFSGVVEEIDLDNNMVKVTVSALFGKETTVELELDQVELAE